VRRAGLRLRPVRPLARETSAGRLRFNIVGQGLGPGRGGVERKLRVLDRGCCPCPVRGSVVRRGFGLASRSGPAAVERRRARQAERASARRPCSRHRGGDQADRGRARGSCWLQKSTSGAWSGSRGPGLAGWLTRPGGGAQQVKRRRKPGRGGESHQHASSDTGGGFPAIPRAGAQAPARPGEGALVDGRRPGTAQAAAFDEAAEEAAPGAPRRRGYGSDAVSVAGHDRGRQRSSRKPDERSRTPPAGGAARRSRRSGLRQDRAAPHTWTSRASAPGGPSGAHVMVAARPKLEVRRQAKLHLVGSSGKRPAGSPASPPRLTPRMGQRSGRGAARRSAPGRSRESNGSQGARDGSRLQKSVRRIFPAANAAPESATGVDGKAAAGTRGSSRRPACP